MASPYITPEYLTSAPTGIAWEMVPVPQATTEQQVAEQTNICWRTTGMIDAYCNQVIRATIDNEEQSGPDYRVTVQNGTGNTRMTLQRWPITSILAVQVAANAVFPRQWQQVPEGMYDVEKPVIGPYGSSTPTAAGDGGQAILIAPGYVGWGAGRNGYRIAASYVNGWPHTSLTQPASAGESVIQVDDVTGWTGASAFVYDGADTETVTATSASADAPLTLPHGGGTAPAGPGTLTLSAPLTADHGVGVMVSSIPQNILQAAVLISVVQALESGMLAIGIQNVPGSETVGGQGTAALETAYKELLSPYRRVV